jgi:hypothetical protein
MTNTIKQTTINLVKKTKAVDEVRSQTTTIVKDKRKYRKLLESSRGKLADTEQVVHAHICAQTLVNVHTHMSI